MPLVLCFIALFGLNAGTGGEFAVSLAAQISCGFGACFMVLRHRSDEVEKEDEVEVIATLHEM